MNMPTQSPSQSTQSQRTDNPAEALRHIINSITQAAAHKQTVRIQGGSSKAHLAGYAPQADMVIDTLQHQGIVAHDPSELFITARAGTPLSHIQATLAEHGQHLAFEPPFTANATIGGAVASALSGPARVSQGAVRDFVLGVQMVNGQGQLLQFGGQVMKNVAGYDVSRLMAGSWGSLGFISEATIKVLPTAPAETSLRFAMPQAQALQMLRASCALPLPLNASCWLPDEGGTLWLRLRGARAAVLTAQQTLCQQWQGQEANPTQAQALWHTAQEQQWAHWQHRTSQEAVWRVSVPPHTPVMDLPFTQLVEWHGGLRWVVAPAQSQAVQQLMDWAHAAGGHVRMHLPAADCPTVFTQSPLAPALHTIHQRVKAALDPAGIFTQPHPVF